MPLVIRILYWESICLQKALIIIGFFLRGICIPTHNSINDMNPDIQSLVTTNRALGVQVHAFVTVGSQIEEGGAKSVVNLRTSSAAELRNFYYFFGVSPFFTFLRFHTGSLVYTRHLAQHFRELVQPTAKGCVQSRMALQTAQHKFVKFLKTLQRLCTDLF